MPGTRQHRHAGQQASGRAIQVKKGTKLKETGSSRHRAGRTGGAKARPSAAISATGTRARVARVRAEYPNQLNYSRFWTSPNPATEKLSQLSREARAPLEFGLGASRLPQGSGAAAHPGSTAKVKRPLHHCCAGAWPDLVIRGCWGAP